MWAKCLRILFQLFHTQNIPVTVIIRITVIIVNCVGGSEEMWEHYTTYCTVEPSEHGICFVSYVSYCTLVGNETGRCHLHRYDPSVKCHWLPFHTNILETMASHTTATLQVIVYNGIYQHSQYIIECDIVLAFSSYIIMFLTTFICAGKTTYTLRAQLY